MELLFAYIAGLLTLVNPCVLPVLPIVLATAVSADRRGPVALAAGMCLSFVAFGMFVATIGFAIGLTEELMARIGAFAMLGFGIILLVPQLSARFETAFSGVAGSADSALGNGPQTGLRGQFVGGLLLGAVWSPCIGPTLGGAIALAAQGESLLWVSVIMLAFGLGVATLILTIGLGGQELIRTRAQKLRGLATRSKTILGIVFVAVGLMILFKVHHYFEFWANQVLPHWLIDLSVSF